MKKISLSILFALLVFGAKAQTSTSLYFMENVPQSTKLNPALQPRTNMYIGVPITNIHENLHTNFNVKNLFQEKGGLTYTFLQKEYDYNQLYDKYKHGLSLNNDLNTSLLSGGFRLGKAYLTFSYDAYIALRTNIPTDAFKLLDKGLPDGTKLSFKDLRFNTLFYTDLSASISAELTDKLTAGIRVKQIMGIIDIRTKFDQLDLYTSKDKWELSIDGKIDAALPIDITGPNGEMAALDSISFNSSTKTFLPSLRNPGWGFDIGAQYDINENLSVSAALNNVGFIVWARQTNNLTMKGKYTYTGVHCETGSLNDIRDNVVNSLEKIADSIRVQIEPKPSNKTYSTALTPSLYVGSEYKPCKCFSVGVLSATKFTKPSIDQQFSVSANFNPRRDWFSATTGFNYNVKGAITASMGMSINLKVLQLYTVIDNIPLTYRTYTTPNSETKSSSSINVPYNFNNFSMAFGMNIMIGSSGPKDK